jgi:hypothetical protein
LSSVLQWQDSGRLLAHNLTNGVDWGDEFPTHPIDYGGVSLRFGSVSGILTAGVNERIIYDLANMGSVLSDLRGLNSHSRQSWGTDGRRQ